MTPELSPSDRETIAREAASRALDEMAYCMLWRLKPATRLVIEALWDGVAPEIIESQVKRALAKSLTPAVVETATEAP